MEVQPPGAKLPRPLMAIGALEVRRGVFVPGRDVPASAAFVGNQGARGSFLGFLVLVLI